MTLERWNRLYRRMQIALRRHGYHEGNRLKQRWLNWAERTTGKTCFFVPYN